MRIRITTGTLVCVEILSTYHFAMYRLRTSAVGEQTRNVTTIFIWLFSDMFETVHEKREDNRNQDIN